MLGDVMAALAFSRNQSEVDSFLGWVARTGRPHDWRLLVLSKPPADCLFEIGAKFEVPAELRSKVQRAPCPICQPNSPKYYSGYLIFFPNEGTYRAIGHVCGGKHFGAERFEIQVKALKSRLGEESALEFLFVNLPNTHILRAAALALLERGREIDKLRATLLGKITQALANRILRHGGDGLLRVFGEREVSAVGTDGRESRKREAVEVANFPMSGLGFLRSGYSAEAWATNALKELAEMPGPSDDSIQAALIAWGEHPGRYAAAKRSYLGAVENLLKARALVSEAKSFLHQENIRSLGRWAAHEECPEDLRAGIDSAGRIVIAIPGGGQFVCEMRSCIMDPLPTLPTPTNGH
jgi:hypothetical protein